MKETEKPKRNIPKAILPQMALECGRLHSTGGGASRLCHSPDPSHYVVEQKAAA